MKYKGSARQEETESAMETLMKKVSHVEEESDECFATLEESRLRLDERMVEMQERQRKNTIHREKHQHTEEQKIQLKVVQLMVEQPLFSVPPLTTLEDLEVVVCPAR